VKLWFDRRRHSFLFCGFSIFGVDHHMSSKTIFVERVVRDRVRVAVVTIDRPHARNAVDSQTADALFRAVRAVDQDPDVMVGVLCGANGSFCSGADLRALDNVVSIQENDAGPMGPSRLETRKPWIAALSGYAVAGGLELALWCDLRVVEQSCVMGVFCRRWGVPLVDGGSVRLPALIGLSHALDLILTGRGVSADEAARLGLANRVVADGTARDVAVEMAFQIGQFPQKCVLNDRASAIAAAYGGVGAQRRLLELEVAFGKDSLTDSNRGVAEFRKGAGRHGQPAKL
jgi:enoyl-CoA hydratase